ncbi:potassium channel related protein [Vibrio cholerae]|uniref:ion channel n=1 Tax=Vibrio cholerae TaxID=666 RepID=UPI000A0FE7DC|nr:ion channel [Vibrio cholerae]EGQ8223772.1 potassium channel related protein [Vibrio cholerae]EGR0478819.1 potassium channel related protein [Vibrio cholerae]EGR0509221.1 potassium channel related protein [Vibrio cholerae]MCU4220618.1 ion channel [Vibrio cholerae]ORP13468.1 potassium channel related protein [Vibrio cholerae]
MQKNISKKLIELWDEYFSVVAEGLGKLHLGLLTLSFVLIVYCGYQILGEDHLIESPIRMTYYLVTVGSTVGFGDLHPLTELGQAFTALVVIPGSLGLFALVAGKLLAKGMSLWYRKQKGMHTVRNKSDHIVLVGYNQNRTPSLVKQIVREDKRDIVLISVEQHENPLPNIVSFINVPSFTNEDELERSALSRASCIIIDTDADENTLTIALFASSLNGTAHLVAHFSDPVKAKILKLQCPNAEVISNLSTELLAKSVIDSGSSLLHSEMVSAERGQTQYGIEVKSEYSFKVMDIFIDFKQKTESTIIGMRRRNEKVVILNPDLETIIHPGDTLYYISDERVDFDQWPTP